MSSSVVNIAAVVLAGGASSRFGADKLAADLDGKPLLHHALAAAAEVASSIVLVVAPGAPAPSIPPSLASRVAVARDDALHQGPLAGLVAGLRACPADAAAVIVVGGDMPSLEPAVLRLLVAALRADPILAVVTLEAEPGAALPMAVRASLAGPAAAALLGESRRALRGLLDRVPSSVVPFATWRALDPDARTLRDIDIRADLEDR